ncbi:competence type IV pilus minor pilin ComGG [Enterococcus dongliensis]|uniref:competence type IV pilus minor pilin ComGG n=1 Tax=Enterococcus dongliensis TaxID=2559925 RepID=UPI002892175A|nr:competence type IV pilus minor pilin ComGG [Enterococcus dongliensis]MDT2612977.1 competence type IV pilus minor pilin ComGG [Enterococcus dongliensis]MDT2672074.1 competence type IV pilus minor pilin ComGG [Enterococcus dongliensis]
MAWILALLLLTENKKRERGFLNSQGGVLLSVLMAIFLFSFLLLNVTTSYHQTVDLAIRTEQLYQAKIAKELFLAEYPKLHKNNGIWKFNKGELAYETEATQLKIIVKIKKKTYHFYEKTSTSTSLD